MSSRVLLRIKVLCLLLFGTVLVCSAFFPSVSKRTSVGIKENPLSVKPAVLDFGEVMKVTVVAGSVELINNSSDPIIFKDAVPSCTSCTEIDMPKRELAPKGKIKLDFRVDMTGKTGQTENSFLLVYHKKNNDYLFTAKISTVAQIAEK